VSRFSMYTRVNRGSSTYMAVSSSSSYAHVCVLCGVVCVFTLVHGSVLRVDCNRKSKGCITEPD